jgi:hypothetical protein
MKKIAKSPLWGIAGLQLSIDMEPVHKVFHAAVKKAWPKAKRLENGDTPFWRIPLTKKETAEFTATEEADEFLLKLIRAKLAKHLDAIFGASMIEEFGSGYSMLSHERDVSYGKRIKTDIGVKGCYLGFSVVYAVNNEFTITYVNINHPDYERVEQ